MASVELLVMIDCSEVIIYTIDVKGIVAEAVKRALGKVPEPVLGDNPYKTSSLSSPREYSIRLFREIRDEVEINPSRFYGFHQGFSGEWWRGRSQCT